MKMMMHMHGGGFVAASFSFSCTRSSCGYRCRCMRKQFCTGNNSSSSGSSDDGSSTTP